MIGVALAPTVVHVSTTIDGWTIGADAAVVVAAVAACIALFFAWQTANKQAATLEVMNNMLTTTKTAHAEEMAERRRQYAAELALRRIEQMHRVVEATIELRDQVALGVRSVDARDLVPPLGAKLGAVLLALNALRGPAAPEELVKLARGAEEQT